MLLCLTDTSLYIYRSVKHFGVANIKLKLKTKLTEVSLKINK